MGELSITRETALKDIGKIRGRFATLGPGSELDRSAQLVIQPIQILLRRLDKPEILELLYRGEEVKKLLPESVQEIIQRLFKEEITAEEARAQLEEVLKLYQEVFVEMGISPQTSKILAFK